MADLYIPPPVSGEADLLTVILNHPNGPDLAASWMIEHWRARSMGHFRRLGAGTLDAEELFHDALTLFIEKAEAGAIQNTERPSAFFWTLRYRLFLNHLKKEGRRKNRDDRARPANLTWIDRFDEKIGVDDVRNVERAIAEMEGTCKKVMTMRLAAESYPDIAEDTGLTVPAIKRGPARCFKQFIEILIKNGYQR